MALLVTGAVHCGQSPIGEASCQRPRVGCRRSRVASYVKMPVSADEPFWRLYDDRPFGKIGY